MLTASSQRSHNNDFIPGSSVDPLQHLRARSSINKTIRNESGKKAAVKNSIYYNKKSQNAEEM